MAMLTITAIALVLVLWGIGRLWLRHEHERQQRAYFKRMARALDPTPYWEPHRRKQDGAGSETDPIHF